ncbi:MAG: DUF2341 domain-containing protein [Acidobacteria bacterium]|nr:DUF2341 domain-containing protein [Acidobacteriota bacterium]
MGAWRSRAHVGVRAAAAVAAICLFTADRGIAGTLLDGFREEVVWSGLSLPTAMAFAPDGRVYVAEKSGLVKVYASLSDPTPDIVADLRANVHDFWDRGLLGIAVDPEFPTRPFVYVLYTWNRDLQDPASADPRWPDSCPNPPGDTNDGCVVDGRLARLELDGNGALVAERVLLEGRWCQQYPSHSIGALAFDDDERVLYVSAGDGASFNWVDYGQGGGDAGSPTPTNPCGDPPSGRGGVQSAPLAEGGALRSQDIRTSGDPVGLNGTILRLDPDTGAAAAGNPLQGGDPGDDMIIAYGLRNPFRFALRPGTDELYVGDVGWNNFEEINRVADATDAVVENFGWPCYEGPNRQNGYDAADLALCENLYVDAVAPATPPFFAYQHGGRVQLAQDPWGCAKTGSSSVSGVAFPAPGPYPSRFDGALYFSDYSRDCVFVMEPGPDGRPDPATRRTLIDAAANPVFLAAGPDGHIYYIDIDAGRILRVAYAEENDPPVARVDATPANGPAPLSVSFDGSLSSDPDPLDTVTHRWDLDGDGSFDDATGATASWVYLTPGVYQAALQVEDDSGATNVAVVPITAGNTAPVLAILEPSSSYLWRAGEEIVFRGEATDPENGTLPPASLRWRINLQHCHDGPDDCHTHPLIEQDGVQEGSFTAPDHEYYSYLEITLTATDLGIPGQSGGVLSSSMTIALDPLTTTLALRSEPPGLKLTFYDHTHASPLDETVIVDSTNTISAPSPQDRGGRAWTFVSWSNGGPRSHDVFVPEEGLSVTAAFSDSGVAGDWWDTEWPRRKRFQVRSQGLTEMLMNVPVLVTVDASTIEYGSIADDGADLRFVSHDGTPLAHEIEVWDETGTSRVWVRLPTLDPGGHHDHDTHFFAYYGNTGAPDAQDAASVWSANYAGVWHLDPSLRDSSPHGHHLADNGTADALGAIGRGRTFNGTSWLDAGTSASWRPPAR